MEVEFRDGDALLGMMGDSCKAKDVLRDPRLAVHSPTVDPPEGDDGTWPGEAKIAGRALEQRGDGPEGTPPGARFFAIDIDEVVLTTIGDPADHLVIESWHPGRGVERRERR